MHLLKICFAISFSKNPGNPHFKNPDHVPYHEWLDRRKAEINVTDYFELKPKYEEYDVYIKKFPDVAEGILRANEYFDKEGTLNFTSLVGDSYIHLARDGEDNIIDFTTHVL